MLRDLQLTKIDERLYLFPIPVVKERKYLISCSSPDEAKKIMSAVKLKILTHPDLLSEHFIFLTYHKDKQTKIFVLNPKSLPLIEV